MKVILLADVQGVGEAGSVATVADGHARNLLIPRKLAIEATKGALKGLEHHRGAIRRKQATEATDAGAVGERLSEITLRLTAKAGEAGRLFGSITHSTVAEALAADYEIKIDRRSVSFPYPIRTIGAHEARIRLHEDVEASLQIEVVPESEAQP